MSGFAHRLPYCDGPAAIPECERLWLAVRRPGGVGNESGGLEWEGIYVYSANWRS